MNEKQLSEIEQWMAVDFREGDAAPILRLLEERKRLLGALREMLADDRLPPLADWHDARAFAEEEAP